MMPAERLAFLTALGLASLGRERMERACMDEALVFLLEADLEWKRVGPHWRDQVDNYGLLQLDIFV